MRYVLLTQNDKRDNQSIKSVCGINYILFVLVGFPVSVHSLLCGPLIGTLVCSSSYLLVLVHFVSHENI